MWFSIAYRLQGASENKLNFTTMLKASILERLTAKSEVVKTEKKTVKKVATAKEVDPNSPAPARLTYALYQANRAASKINACKVFNDWHKQGLTTKEANDLIAEYNKVTGYVYKPKEKVEKSAKKTTTAKSSALDDILKESGVTPAQLIEAIANLTK